MLHCTIKICDTGWAKSYDFVASGATPAVDCPEVALITTKTLRETTMNKLLVLIMVSLFVGVAYAADTKDTTAATATKANPQQEKMKACNQKAGDKKGDERQAFMKTCLSAKAEPAKAEPPKSKMAMCNEKTKGMTKADADKTRSECMKAS